MRQETFWIISNCQSSGVLAMLWYPAYSGQIFNILSVTSASTKDSSKPWKHKEMQLQLTNIVEAKLYWGLSLLGGERAWSSTFYLKSIAMDSVQVRKVEPPLVTRHAYQHTKRSCWLIRSRWPVPSERVWDFVKNFCKTRLAVFLPQPIWPLLLGIEWGKLQTAPKSL